MKSCLVIRQARGRIILSLASALILSAGLGGVPGLFPAVLPAYALEQVQSTPSDATGWYARGLNLYTRGEYAEARKAFAETLRLDADHKGAQQFLAHVETKLAAAAAPVQVADARSAPPAPAPTEAEIRARQQRIDQLYEAAEKLYKDEKYREANDKLKQLFEIAPDHAKGRALAEKVAGELGQEPVEDTSSAVRAALDKQANDLVEEGNRALKDEDFDLATQKFQAALKLQPDHRRATSGLEKATTGRAKEAERRAKEEAREAERVAKAQAEQQKRAEADAARAAQEKTRAEAVAQREQKKEADRLAKAEAEKEKRAAEEQARAEKDAKTATERIAKAEAKQREEEIKAAEADAKRQERDTARQMAAQKTADEAVQQMAAQKAADEAAQQTAAQKAADEAAKQTAAQKAADEAAQQRAAQKAADEAAAKRAAQKTADEAAAKMAAQKTADEAATKMAATKAADEAARQMAAQKAAEEAARQMAAAQPAAPPSPEPAAVQQSAGIAAPVAAQTSPDKQVDVAVWLDNAKRYLDNGNYDSAEAAYRNVLLQEPDNARAERGLVLVQRARLRALRQNSEAARQPDSVLERANTALAAGNLKLARDLYQEALLDDPNNEAARVGLSSIAEMEMSGGASRAMAPSAPAMPAAPVVPPVAGRQAEGEIALAKAFVREGRLDQAEKAYRDALAKHPGNDEAIRGLDEVRQAKAQAAIKEAERQANLAREMNKGNVETANRLVDQGKALAEAGELLEAVNRWQQALRLDSTNVRAQMFLNQYAAAANVAEERAGAALMDASREAEYQRQLDMAAPDFSYTAPGGEDVKRILSDLSQVSGLDFVATEDVQKRVVISLSGMTIRQVLDAILIPNGFKYERVGETVFVSPDYLTRVFRLSEAEYDLIKRMLSDPTQFEQQEHTIQYLLYGEITTPPPGKKLQLNDEYHTLLVTDSAANIDKIKQFIDNLEPALGDMALVDKSFFLDPTISKDLFKIVEMTLYPVYGPQAGIGANGQRMLMLKDDIPEVHVLWVRDTLKNIRKVEELLQQKPLLDQLKRGELQVKSFRVTTEVPDAGDEEARERTRQMTDFAYKMLRFMLYSQDGEQQAMQEGRRIEIHRDDATLGRIDVIDYPENLARVEAYLNSILEQAGDTDTIRSYTIQIGNIFEVTDAIVRILLAQDEQSRRVFINTQVLGQSGRPTSGSARGQAQGIQLQTGNIELTGGGQNRSPTSLIVSDEAFLDVYDALFYPDPWTSTLYVRARDPILFDKVQTLVDTLDIAPKQLEIEARLVEVALTDLRSVGVDWSLSGPGRQSIDFDNWDNNDVVIDALNAQSPQGVLFSFATLGETQLNATLSLLSSLNSAEVLSAPRMVTRSAPSSVPRINVGTRLPYIENIQVLSDNNDDPTDNRLQVDYAWVEVGIALNVYPVVTANNHVYLDIYPQISVVTDRLPVTITGQEVADPAAAEALARLGQPVIDLRESYNEVFLNNGETLVLGGLIRDEVQNTESRVPGLHRIPFIGALFKDKGTTKIKRTLLIFVTVNVLQTR